MATKTIAAEKSRPEGRAGRLRDCARTGFFRVRDEATVARLLLGVRDVFALAPCCVFLGFMTSESCGQACDGDDYRLCQRILP